MTPYEELDALYATLPTVNCQRKCHDYCGPILIPKIEAQRLEDKRGYLRIRKDFEPNRAPHLPPPELIKANYVGLEPEPNRMYDFPCVFLSDLGACQAYLIRPLVCRAWGCTDHPLLRCPHGCLPSPRWITVEEFRELNLKVVEIQNAIRSK